MDKRSVELIAFRCKREDRAELQRLSKSLTLSESDVARVALRVGLKLVSEHGIQPKPEAHPG